MKPEEKPTIESPGVLPEGRSDIPSGEVASGECERREVLDKVREHVFYASQVLRKLGPEEYSRLGWLLEDTLMYLEEAESDQEVTLA